MGAPSMRPTRSTRNSTSAFTLVELLVASVVAMIVVGVVLPVALSGRRIYTLDRNRTTVNQNLRGALDLLGADVRQAAELLPASFPAIVVVDGGNGPDELILRRNLLDAVLPVCREVQGDVVFVADPGRNDRPDCAEQPDRGDGWPENLGAWRDYRLERGPVVAAYVYDPVARLGEFFPYDDEDGSGLKIHRGAGSWAREYTPRSGSRVYLLEERRYRLSGDLLQLIVNGDAGNPLNLASGVRDFQLSVLMPDGTTLASLGGGWAGIKALDVRLEGLGTDSGQRIERSLGARFFPRNALSN